MSADAFPAVLWLVSCAISIAICVLCVGENGRCVALVGRRAREESGVTPVGLHVIGLHVLSVLFASVSYLIGSLGVATSDDGTSRFSPAWSEFYRQAAVPSAVVIVLVIATQLIFLILRARTASFSQMNARLNGSTSTKTP